MSFSRHSGILLHPTSLPGPYGSGDLGPSAYHFIDWLVVGAQSRWQVLPLGGVGPGNSPYMSPSAFAGNELLIDLTQLRDAGWLTDANVVPPVGAKENQINYHAVRLFRMSRLRIAAERFFGDRRHNAHTEFSEFCARNSRWLDDYALFMALDAKHGHGGRGKVWQNWPTGVAQRKSKALKEAAEKLADECDFWKFCQWLFFSQWTSLKHYANSRDIEIIGDMPLFVSPHSADVWANQQLFDLDEKGYPRVVAGVPPDYFSATGQHWGNPLYKWSAHAHEGYRWWIERMRATLGLCDIVRIDHFRGLESYWEIPADEETAIKGRWKKGPGMALFTALQKALDDSTDPSTRRQLKIIAEDLGIITPEVTALRQAVGLPGMRILHFAFNGNPDNLYLPHNFERNAVVYTGTHDNDTTLGWWKSLSEQEKDFVRRYLSSNGNEIHWDLIRAASSSIADLSIIPMQDVLGLDTNHRMNRPGQAEGAWGWRFSWSQVAPWHAERIAEITRLYGRTPRRRTDTHPTAAG